MALPQVPSIDRLRRDAAALKKSHSAGDPAALERVARAMRVRRTLKHADFLHVLATEQGFASWPQMKSAVEIAGMDRAARQQRLKIALYHGHGWAVERLLEETLDLADGLFGLECALYRVDAVRRALEEKPQLAITQLGPRRPILHLAFSRWILHRPELEPDMIAVAELLVANGADVNDGVPVHPGSDHRLSALYGAIGHVGNMALARWLLDRGADPNDGESLYHSTELGHREGLRMLLEAGADPKGTNALLRAMDFHDHEAVELLLAHGARADDFDGTHVGGEAPWVVPALHQAARRGSDERMIALLLDHGADPGRTYEGAGVYGYARVFGNTALARALEERGMVQSLTPTEMLLAAAAEGRATRGTLLVEELPQAYRHIIRMLVGLPDRLGHIQRLVELGLPFDAPDAEGLTPVQVAGWEGLTDATAWFLSLGPDLRHVNNYGGSLVGTILHGAQNCPARAERDHAACLRLALDAGARVYPDDLRDAGDEELAGLLADWVATHPA